MKKTRRMPRASGSQTEAGVGPTVSVVPFTPSSRRATTTAIPTAEELAEEYRYVTKDLQRIALLAVVMLGVLVVLAFALPAMGM